LNALAKSRIFVKMESDSVTDPTALHLRRRLIPARSRSKAFLVAIAIIAVALGSLLLGSSKLSAQDSGSWLQGSTDQGVTYDEQPYDASAAARQPLAAGQLEQLVAPIALYPDALVAQVLAAATYPQQVADADRWRQTQAYATPDQIAYAADAQNWDPSVKALTAFPQVLAEMDRNLQWTTDLGNAYYNQPQDVLEAVQVMRQRAQAAGTLRSSPQEVVRYDAGVIQLVPADPQVVYVPTYNPWAVYGEAVTPYPGFSLLGVIGDALGAVLRYGPGFAMSAFAHTPWGWLAWGLDWLGHALLFHDAAYYSHSATVADWGFPHHRFYAYSGHGFGRDYARGWGNESWRHESGFSGSRNGRYDSNGWHSFGRGNERVENARRENENGRRENNNWNRASMTRPSDRGFESLRGERNSEARFDNREANRAGVNRPIENRSAFSSAFNEGRSHNQKQTRGDERAFAGNFARNDFSGRSSGFSSHSSGKSHGGGLHLFGGGHSEKSFNAGHTEHFRTSGHAPKSLGGGKNFASSKSFGGGKSFSGGHSHGGHSGGGHSSGKHHR
jgi:hypothetical protein